MANVSKVRFKRVEVSWYDAAWSDDVKIEEILSDDTTRRFIKRTTAGWLIKQDKHGVIVAVDIQEHGLCDIFGIPTEFKPKVKYL